MYHVTFTVINWIDVFIRNEYKEILITSWKHCIDHKGLEIYGWCIMTSHVHMIIGSNKINLKI
ncbi:MAG: transposase [Bacteroidetes bacterium]|nr:transposase [Bacteroidota bacterium]